MSEQLVNYMADMMEEEAIALAKAELEAGAPPQQILDDCRAAMEIVGKRFETGEYFLPELMLAGEMLKAISAEVKPRMQSGPETKKGAKILVGTVAGDIHDIGKDIVVFMLDVNGFDVLDLGIDVPVRTFVEKVTEFQPRVVALSGFLTLAYDSMKQTVDAFKAAGLRDGIKIMIGGGTMDDTVCQYAGADAYGLDAMAAVTLAKSWTS